MEDNTKMEVKINNMEYTIVSNESEEYVQRVALLVNKKISEVKSQEQPFKHCNACRYGRYESS